MFAAGFEIFLELGVNSVKTLIFALEGIDLIVAFLNLAASHFKHVLSLLDGLGEVVVPHGFSLCGFLVVDSLTAILICIGRGGRIVSLQLGDVSLCFVD